jgi:hypothetical protein
MSSFLQPNGAQHRAPFTLMWLNPLCAENLEYENVREQLRCIIHRFQTFNESDECAQYIQNTNGERIVLFADMQSGDEILSQVHELSQLSAIYFYGEDRSYLIQFTKASFVYFTK